MIDREKDKDKDKDKGDKESNKTSNVIKSGINDTKENVKKFINKDKQNSKVSLQLNPITIDEQQITSNNVNGDVKSASSNSPIALIKRPSDVMLKIEDNGQLPDIVNMSLIDTTTTTSNGIIISPFEVIDGDTDIDQLSTPVEQQLKISSSSSNILMDNNNKLLGNVQVSQV